MLRTVQDGGAGSSIIPDIASVMLLLQTRRQRRRSEEGTVHLQYTSLAPAGKQERYGCRSSESAAPL